MKNQKSTQILVKSILKKYSICNYCLGRLISKKLCLKPSKNLGKKFNIKSTDSSLKKCFICKNIFEKLDQVVAQMIQNSSSYEFQTFLVGSVIKPSISDNDDIIKSKFKIKGVLNVKTHINHEISKSIEKTNRLIIVDEDVSSGATGYMLDKILVEQNAFFHLDSAPQTLSAKDHRPAYGTDGDYFSKPNVDDIIEGVYAIMNETDPLNYPKLY